MWRDVDLREHVCPFSFCDGQRRDPRVCRYVRIKCGTDEDVGESTRVKTGRDIIGGTDIVNCRSGNNARERADGPEGEPREGIGPIELSVPSYPDRSNHGSEAHRCLTAIVPVLLPLFSRNFNALEDAKRRTTPMTARANNSRSR